MNIWKLSRQKALFVESVSSELWNLLKTFCKIIQSCIDVKKIVSRRWTFLNTLQPPQFHKKLLIHSASLTSICFVYYVVALYIMILFNFACRLINDECILSIENCFWQKLKALHRFLRHFLSFCCFLLSEPFFHFLMNKTRGNSKIFRNNKIPLCRVIQTPLLWHTLWNTNRNDKCFSNNKINFFFSLLHPMIAAEKLLIE